MSKKILYISFILLAMLTATLYSNPFVNNKNTPAPVKGEKASGIILEQQQKLHTELGEYIYRWTRNKSQKTFWTIMMIAFFYGFVHALGPGHRKTVVFSFYLTKKAPIWEPLLTSLILAALHGITSAVLLIIFRNIKGAVSVHTATAGVYLEGFSLVILMILSVVSLLHVLSHVYPKQLSWFHFGCGCTCTHDNYGYSRAEDTQSIYANCVSHTHHCSKRRHNIPDAQQNSRQTCSCTNPQQPDYTHVHTEKHIFNLQPQPKCSSYATKHGSSVYKMQWGAFILSGIYPCPAALLVLVLIVNLDAVGLGVSAIISMSLGMTMPIIAVAYLAWAGRIHLFNHIRNTQKYVQRVTLLLSITAYGTIFVLSLRAAFPFLYSLLVQ